MKLYICGNGFDQHHNLPTSYWEYKTFLEEYHPSIYKDYDSFPNLNETDKNSRWSDIEAALCIDYDELFYEALQDYYPDLSSESDSRWQDLDIDIDLLTRFINDFTGRCFFEWITKAEQREAAADLVLEKDSIFINFNYTNTLQRLYQIPDSSVFHIHGALKNLNGADVLWRDVLPDNPSVETAEAIGVLVEGDQWSSGYIRDEIQFGATGITAEEVDFELTQQYENDEFYAVAIRPAIQTLVEFVKKSTKCTRDNYQKLSDFLEGKPIDEVVIMGVSLGEADDAYYSDVIVPKLRNVKWTFMLHGTDSSRIDNFIKKYGISDFAIQIW